MRVLDAILCVSLLVGNLLALPIWWWLFVTPVIRLGRWSRGLKTSRYGPWQIYEGHSNEVGPVGRPAALR